MPLPLGVVASEGKRAIQSFAMKYNNASPGTTSRLFYSASNYSGAALYNYNTTTTAIFGRQNSLGKFENNGMTVTGATAFQTTYGDNLLQYQQNNNINLVMLPTGSNPGAGSRTTVASLNLSSSGSVNWAKTFNDQFAGYITLGAITVKPNGNTVIWYNANVGAGVIKNHLAEIDTAGNILWVKVVETNKTLSGSPILITISALYADNNNIYVAGYYSEGSVPTYTVLCVYKFTSTGSLIWTRILQNANTSLYPTVSNVVATITTNGNTVFQVTIQDPSNSPAGTNGLSYVLAVVNSSGTLTQCFGFYNYLSIASLVSYNGVPNITQYLRSNIVTDDNNNIYTIHFPATNTSALDFFSPNTSTDNAEFIVNCFTWDSTTSSYSRSWSGYIASNSIAWNDANTIGFIPYTDQIQMGFTTSNFVNQHVLRVPIDGTKKQTINLGGGFNIIYGTPSGTYTQWNYTIAALTDSTTSSNSVLSNTNTPTFSIATSGTIYTNTNFTLVAVY